MPKYVHVAVVLHPCLTIIDRRGRGTISEKEQLAQDTEEALKRKELEAEERKKQSHDMVAESIRRELLESVSVTTIIHCIY